MEPDLKTEGNCKEDGEDRQEEGYTNDKIVTELPVFSILNPPILKLPSSPSKYPELYNNFSTFPKYGKAPIYKYFP